MITQRIRDGLLTRAPNARQAAAFLKALQPDGRWKDVDYRHRGRSGWATVEHLGRVHTMAQACRHKDSALHGDRRLLAAIGSALDYWLANDPQNPNWWWNRIGVPRSVGQVAILLGPDLSPRQRDGVLKILARSRFGMTGQNRVWLAGNQLMRGCLAADPQRVAAAFREIAAEIRVTTAEGLQPDFSFHQHGAQLYSGGYGRGFACDCARYAWLARGTRFALDPGKVELLTRYLLDGQQWMTRGRAIDPSVRGREITRRGRGAGGLAQAARDLAALGGPRAAELAAFADRLDGKAGPGAGAPVGNRCFWRSDLVVHRRRGFHASVRMHSTRTLGYEIVNREGLKSYHLADGCMFLLRRGDEYGGIFPVWDWRKVPGVTCEQAGGPLPTGERRGRTGFVGGASDGVFGLAAMDYRRGAVRARKAWFCFDREIVCLGAGVTAETDNSVATTVNQCLLKGEAVVSDGAGTRKPGRGRAALLNAEWGAWVLHDGVGYVIPATADVKVFTGPQTGSWRSINANAPRDKVTLDVFSVWIDHGRRPKDARYAYLVVPNADAKRLGDCARALPVAILANTTARQAVRHPGLKLTQAAFYQPGSLTGNDGPTVAVDTPCLLLVKEEPGAVRLAVADPTGKQRAVTVQISGKLAGDGCSFDERAVATRVRVELPSGPRAGSSVVRELRRAE